MAKTKRERSEGVENTLLSRRFFDGRTLGAALIAVAMLSACGGGGGDNPVANNGGGTTADGGNNTGGNNGGDTGGNTGGDTGGNTGGDTGGNTGGDTGGNTGGDTGGNSTNPAAVDGATMTMSCVDGANYQCSGSEVLRTENGVALTASGVQVLGQSASNADPNSLALANAGSADVRIVKTAATNGVSSVALILRDLGISWDGNTPRPSIIETFSTAQGRAQLGADGRLSFGPLPPAGSFDYSASTRSGTQANYANNTYLTTETTGIGASSPGEVVGSMVTGAVRQHEDGDILAPNVTEVGSRGFRAFVNWSLQYANLVEWVTQDRVSMADWGAPGANEHDQQRRGLSAFGDVTNPASVPSAGTASYSGYAYGWYNSGAAGTPTERFVAPATITVDFTARKVTVNVQNATTHDDAQTAIPVSFNADTLMGLAGTNTANYLTGSVSGGTLSGGISGRYFGPASATTAPPEMAGTFSLSNATSKATVIGGFVATRQ